MTEKSDIQRWIVSRILDESSGYNLLRALIHHFSLERTLLGLTNYEDAWFFPMKQEFSTDESPEVERISMVIPVSYHFSFVFRLGGYFKVKYGNIPIPLAKSTDPFSLKYSGIIMIKEESPEFRNETLDVFIH
ncbi:MAG: hypothetical protein JW861_13910 [Bacteroidales bacterium]|nr:hypothetical protein [Bacteroidales bacterium]